MKLHAYSLICGLFVSGLAFAEDVKLTTYYPSPSGSYKKLNSDKLITNNSEAVTTEYNAMQNGDAHISRGLILGNAAGFGFDDGAQPGIGGLLMSGNLGIGTTAPTEALQIDGAANAGNILLRSTSGNDPGDIIFKNSANTEYGRLWALSDGLRLRTNAARTSDLFIDYAQGNVGLGTTSPTAKLDVEVASTGPAYGVDSSTDVNGGTAVRGVAAVSGVGVSGTAVQGTGVVGGTSSGFGYGMSAANAAPVCGGLNGPCIGFNAVSSNGTGATVNGYTGMSVTGTNVGLTSVINPNIPSYMAGAAMEARGTAYGIVASSTNGFAHAVNATATGSSGFGVVASATNGSGTGVSGTGGGYVYNIALGAGSGIGVAGYGSLGVRGAGPTGVYGVGTVANSYGIYGTSNQTGSVGVYGSGVLRNFLGANGEYSKGTWTNASSKTWKENFSPVNSFQILDKINQLPISEWNYIKDTEKSKHIGPVAEDFYSLFQVGDDAQHISTIDPSGVALAGIQALTQKIERQERKIEALQAEINELKQNQNSIF